MPPQCPRTHEHVRLQGPFACFPYQHAVLSPLEAPRHCQTPGLRGSPRIVGRLLMRDPRFARPITFFVLYLPNGISSGFITVTLPFMLTRAGVSVAATASVVAIALLPNAWRFVCAPVVDLTLTLRRWYLLGLVACAASLLALGMLPAGPDSVALITMAALLSQVGAVIQGAPVGGTMAHCVADAQKGRAAGWYQAGNLGGTGLGGGAGVWLASHYSAAVAGAALAAAMLVCATALAFTPDVARARSGERLASRLREIGRDFRELARLPEARLVLAMILMPFSIGAASNLWSAVAPDWNASPGLVALATGGLSGVVAAIGCVAGGWVADRVGRWWLFFGAGAAMALVAIGMVAAPRTPGGYAAGVLCYALTQGLSYASFSALVLHVIGRGAAATKYAALSSIGNIPVAYMTALDGWAHDRWVWGECCNWKHSSRSSS